MRSSHFALAALVTIATACSIDAIGDAESGRPGPSTTGGEHPGGAAPASGAASSGGAASADAGTGAAPDGLPAGTPFFATATIEDGASVGTGSDGDLWPSCWSNDDALYAANGDGAAFGGPSTDIVVSRITGAPPNLQGATIARGDAIGQVWTKTGRYNRKPTGMLCVDGALYVAVQDLEFDFMDAPAATIAKSSDKGKTWTWNKSTPMFSQHRMTTLMFLDYGKDNANAIDGNVYVYALDQNWRFSTRVPSPTKLWLARVPKAKVQDKTAYAYYAGAETDGTPKWSADENQRQPVLEDPSKVYTKPFENGFARDMTPISQGGIVYDAPLKRYLYTSWTEYTFEFYEAPQPWGPWKKFLSRDYGVYPWSPASNGGYATTIPSKFISADGKSMFVQSNTFVGGHRNYDFSLRAMHLDPFVYTTASNPKAKGANVALATTGARPLSRAAHAGPSAALNDGVISGSVDSWTGESKTEDFWGVVFTKKQTVNRIAYTTGKMFADGGWFTQVRPQVRVDGAWIDVAGATTTPAYPGSSAAGENKTYVFAFSDAVVDGVRVIGTPGGAKTFTSAAEIAAFFE